MKIKPCTVNTKHKWEFVKNVERKSVNIGPFGSTMKISWNGIYKCACGEKKYGVTKP